MKSECNTNVRTRVEIRLCNSCNGGGRKKGRKKERKEGRKEERKKGRKEERKECRVDGRIERRKR